MLLTIISVLIVIVGLGILILLGGPFVLRLFNKKGGVSRALSMTLFMISVPKEEDAEAKQDKKEDKEIIAVTEQFLTSFTKLRDSFWREFFYGPPHITFEIANPHDDENISFYVGVPKRYATTIEKQIYSFFPKAIVSHAVMDYNIFTPNAMAVGSYLRLKEKPFLPIKTYKQLDTDPLSSITNALSSLKKVEEGAAVQLVIRNAKPKWRKKGHEVVRKMKQGKSINEARRGNFSQAGHGFLKTFFDSITGKKEEQLPNQQGPVNQYQDKQEELRQLTPGEEELLKMVEEKTLKPFFEVNIRLMASAEDKEKALEILAHLESAFSQFDTVDMNSFRSQKPFSTRDMIFNFSFRNFVPRFKSVLSSEEVVSLFHFPIFSTQTPKLNLVKAKTAPAPPNLPQEGLLLGKNVYRDAETKIYLQKNDRRRHLYAIGQTGVGKSGLLTEMARQDIENGEGVCIVDPHGELIEDLLNYIPDERREDVILFDPADVEKPLGLNLLEYDQPEQKTFVINEMINIFDKLYDLKQTGGPMFEQYMRNAMLLVMEDPASGSTLMEIPKVLADADFRKMKLSKCKNQVVVDFWVQEAEKAGGEAALANIVPYITSKLTSFTTNDIMRPIISQQKSAINLREAMDNQKIVLINLSKGKIGELNANLLGMVIVGKVLMSAMGRVDMAEDARKDFYLYIDEFQNFTTDSIASILSEARKYRLNLIIAHQFIQQLQEPIRDAVFGNVGSMVVFRVGAYDAEFLLKQFAPVFSENDLINVDNFNAFVKLMIEGQVSKPFSFATYPPKEKPADAEQRVAAIREYSRNRYGRDREIVEKELRDRVGYLAPPPEQQHPSSSDFSSDMPVK